MIQFSKFLLYNKNYLEERHIALLFLEPGKLLKLRWFQWK